MTRTLGKSLLALGIGGLLYAVLATRPPDKPTITATFETPPTITQEKPTQLILRTERIQPQEKTIEQETYTPSPLPETLEDALDEYRMDYYTGYLSFPGWYLCGENITIPQLTFKETPTIETPHKFIATLLETVGHQLKRNVPEDIGEKLRGLVTRYNEQDAYNDTVITYYDEITTARAFTLGESIGRIKTITPEQFWEKTALRPEFEGQFVCQRKLMHGWSPEYTSVSITHMEMPYDLLDMVLTLDKAQERRERLRTEMTTYLVSELGAYVE